MSANIFPKKLTHEMSKMAMWLFLATEVLLFAGLFTTYAVYRFRYGYDFKAAATELNVLLGSINTIILLFSSFTIAWAVDAIQNNKIKLSKNLILITLVCGVLFLIIKFFEYSAKIHYGYFLSDLAANQNDLTYGKVIFFVQYFIMTGIHGLHVIIGMGIWVYVYIKIIKGTVHANQFTHVEVAGLYWHLVDLIWIFLFPMLYLMA